ncbi:MAG: hypothetical protein LH485_05835 [Sphingomonas bacterium]|nr:hypothetical protein [Sphingomonas bacterium]
MFRRLLARSGACCLVALALVGASLPHAMTGSGQWEIGKTAGGGGDKVCLADPAQMMQWEHRTKQCTRVIVSASIDRAEVHYTCVGGGFGTSRVEVLTPRSVKVDTQGISDGLPFSYVVHARRVGDCPAR